MEHQYEQTSIFENKVFEDYAKRSLTAFITAERERLTQLLRNSQTVQITAITEENLWRRVSKEIVTFAADLVKISGGFTKATKNHLVVFAIAETLENKNSPLNSAIFKPPNNSIPVGTR